MCALHNLCYIGCDDLYKQAVDFTKKSSDQLNALQQLETRLGIALLDTAFEERAGCHQICLVETSRGDGGHQSYYKETS